MEIYIDIDETICIIQGDKNQSRDYSQAIPIVENIKKANKLYDLGHKITYWTARGAQSGIDWKTVTLMQLKKWNVKYNELRLDKPFYDLFICDKALNVNDWE